MSHWLVLMVAVVTEICWALSLKYVQQHPSFLVATGSVLLSFVNMGLLSFSMRGLPAGTAYAVWTGLGAIGVGIGGAIWFHDPVTPARIASMGLIVMGVIGMKFCT